LSSEREQQFDASATLPYTQIPNRSVILTCWPFLERLLETTSDFFKLFCPSLKKGFLHG
jgi:hypothetical protein